jgi:hypothetical protein
VNIENTKRKLKTLSRTELDTLNQLVIKEIEERGFKFLSNTTNSPREQYEGLKEMFANAMGPNECPY